MGEVGRASPVGLLGGHDEFGFCWFSSSGKREKLAMPKRAKSSKGMRNPLKALRDRQLCEKGILLALFGSRVRISGMAETHHPGSNVRQRFLTAELATVL